MREKRSKERSKTPLSLLTYQVEEILVAKNRSVAPLVLSFIYEPENIAMKDLGTLFGTFIVTDHHEDSSYIVNCLAAAAKKEYFVNPRRSVEESFESTLHKINLTLGKLVRDGHINWMGKLHGSIIAIRDRETYFSVTGEATILLLRNNVLSAISEGLADPEAALHPLKTFTDISEGKLLADDKIIVSTPELLELLPHTLLEREAGKLPIDRFAQLLRTALINERSAAATILIDFSESSTEDTKGALRTTPSDDEYEEALRTTPLIENIFSNKAFHKEHKVREEKVAITPAPDTREKERIDNRTGHIYIQAETASPGTTTETALDRGLTILREQCLILFIKGKKYTLKYTALLSEGIFSLLIRCLQWIMQSLRGLATLLSHFLRNACHLLSTAIRDRFSRNTSFTNISFNTKNTPVLSSSPPSTRPLSPVSRVSFFHSLKQARLDASRLTDFTKTSLQKLFSQIISLFEYRSPRQRWLMGITGIMSVIILIGAGVMILRPTATEIPTEVPVAQMPLPIEPVFPPAGEPLTHEISGNEVIAVSQDDAEVIPLVLRDIPFVITRHSIINAETKTSIPLPESATPILLASAMRDLSAIFLYGADKKMYIFYPNAKSAIENTFPLPNDFTLSDMGTYLTYLYAFDATAGRILRFPRAEGGFGAPTEWLKETMPFDEHAKMSIGESILIGSKNSVFSFTKGRGGMLKLSETKTPVNIQGISVSQDGSLTILDATEKRIVRFNKDGELLGQYFSKKLGDASRLATPSNGSTAFVATPDKILSFELQ